MTLDPKTHNQALLKFCPRCGADALRAQSEQRYVCGGCGFEYYLNVCGTVVGVIRHADGRLLCTVRGKDPGAGTLDFPGGFIDFYETAEEALHREIREELNLEITTDRFLCSQPNQYVYSGVLYHTVDFFFLCTVNDWGAMKYDAEIRDSRLMRLEEVDLSEIGFESIRRGVEWMRQHRDGLGLKI